MRARRVSALVCAVVVLSTFAVVSPLPAQAACSDSELVPVFHDVTINQGLGSYLPLVQGKQTVVRFYLSQPRCGDNTQRLEAKSGTLTVSGGGQTTVLTADNLSTPSTLVPFDQAPAANGPGNPLFVVPGSALDPAGEDGFNATFTLDLTYRVMNANNKVVTDNLSATIGEFGNGQPIAAPVHSETLPLKVLSVPLGTTNPAINNTSPQFSSNAAADAAGGFATLARLYPVEDRAGDLKNQSNGVRYSLNASALLDVSQAFSRGTAPNKKFCGSDTEFSLFIQPQLYAYLHEYNTNQTAGGSSVADRVMGVVDQLLSGGCAGGWAGVGSPESWVRTSYDTIQDEQIVDIPNNVGTIMGMETAHNAGAVPCGINAACVGAGLARDSSGDPTHSKNTHADASSPLRAYNTITGTYLDGATSPPINKSVMKTQGIGWTDEFTLFELADRNLLFCSLGGPLTPDCGFYPQTGASAGATQPTFGISGTTNGEPSGTVVVESFVEDDRVVPEQPGSPLTLRQIDGQGNVIAGATRGVPTRDAISIHDEDGNNSDDLGDHLYFFASVPAHENAVSYELVWSDGTVLYKRDLNRAPTFDAYLVSTPDNPIRTDGTVVDFDDFPIGTAITNQYDSGSGSTLDVTFSSTGGTPRISGSCAGVDLEKLQETVGSLETPPCRVGSTSSDPFSLRNNQRINADPMASGLVVTFAQPQSFVRMAAGNGTPGTQATLTATLTDGSKVTDVEEVGLNVSSNTALEIETGNNDIESVRLTYDTPASEEIDDLVFARAGSTIPETTTFIARVTDDEPDFKMTWFAECDDQSLPQKVAADPDLPPTLDPDGLYRAVFTFEPQVDLTCSDGSGAVVSARVNDGVQTATEDNSEDPLPANNHPPTAVIAAPEQGAQVLENQGFTFYGQGVDLDEGILPKSNLRWELFDASGNKLDANGAALGTDVVGEDLFRVQPPPGGWPVAPNVVTSFTVRLTVTDGAGETDTTESAITVLKDEDNDMIPAIIEPCFGGSDNDPLDSLPDSDGDGLFNYEDPDPCSADTNFKASVIDVDPDTLVVGSNGVFTVKMQMNADVRTIDASTVRLSKLGGIAVGGTQFFATRTSIEGNVLVAKFDRDALSDFFNANPGFLNKDVSFAIAGSGATTDPEGNPITYSWEGTDSILVQKK